MPSPIPSAWDLSINDLSVARAAYFRILPSPLKLTTLEAFMDGIASDAVGGLRGRVLRQRIMVGGTTARYSFAAFRVLRSPSFVSSASPLRDLLHGFVLLIEKGSCLAAFHSHASTMSKRLEALGDPVDYEILSRVLEDSAVAFEKLSLRDMSPSQDTVQKKTFEAHDLKPALGLHASSRSIPTALRIKHGTVKHSVAPGTSRVGTSGGKVGLRALTDWVIDVAARLDTYTPSRSYLDAFAKPVSLADALAAGSPVGVLLEVWELENEVGRGEKDIVIKRRDGSWNPAPDRVREELFAIGRVSLPIVTAGGKFIVRHAGRDIGRVVPRKRVLSIQSKLLDRLGIRDQASGAVDSLQQFINSGKALVSFSDATFAYYRRQVFRDHNLLESLSVLLDCFQTLPKLRGVTCEKHPTSPPPSLSAFHQDSVFRVVEDTFLGQYDHMVLDDMGDEWADHIGVRVRGANAEVAFFHEKHGATTTTSASELQEVVAQAFKNLGHLYESPPGIDVKVGRWEASPTWSGTRISRLRGRGGRTWTATSTAFKSAMARPDAVRRVVLVVSFVSKTALARELGRLRSGTVSHPHLLQCLWLLSVFAGVCRERGALPMIVSAP